ncbi:MAG TPA: carboxypeptidase regulatory-like domain-containing protein [Longimicrobiales bacterium]|nr:carboxypeptidase regulatory-like domain-containing protein [Longimicrobiales bacterium]
MLHDITGRSPNARSPAAGLSIWCLLSLLALLPDRAAAQRASLDVTIHGTVVEEDTGEPIVDAWVRVLDDKRRTLGSARTDDDGRFTFTRLNPGPIAFRVARIGYREITTPYWRVQSGEALDVTIRLDATAVLLAPLEITALTRSRSPMLAAFYQRLDRRLGGTFFSRADIERRAPAQITDLLVDVPGIRLEGGSTVGARIVTFDRTLFATGGGMCPVQVYVDGMPARGEVSLNDLASPAALEGMEVYKGLATAPPEFHTPEARCGVIALWTRRGG